MISAEVIEKLVSRILTICRPESIFLYGSRARDDARQGGDTEIGVVLPRERYVTRSRFLDVAEDQSTQIYPFVEEELTAGVIRTPFEPHFFARDLLLSAKTLYGRPLDTVLRMPAIGTLDALLEVRFSTGRALSAVLEHRSESRGLALDSFFKSFIYAARVLVLESTGRYLIRYPDILAAASDLVDDDNLTALPSAAAGAREGVAPDPEAFYRNLDFCTRLVEPAVRRRLAAGHITLAEGAWS